jgi:hypothetical protein
MVLVHTDYYRYMTPQKKKQAVEILTALATEPIIGI